jgi:methionyl aminopeptidase
MKLNAKQKLKSQFDIEKIHDAGKILASIFALVRELDLEGMTTLELDEFVEHQINKNSVRPAFKTVVGYNHATCISINNEVVHGIPSKKKKIVMGDVVKIDIGVVKQGYFADACETLVVPPITKEAKKLVKVTRKCLELAIAVARPGNTLGDIGFAIQSYAEAKGYSVVRDFTGHGVGFALHEAPTVFHYGEQGKGLPLCEGMVIAIEPMINAGSYETEVLEDGWTAVTEDGSLSAQFEHTIAITKGKPMILTI